MKQEEGSIAMPTIEASRETLALDLRMYGEDELAEKVLKIDSEIHKRISERAWQYLPKSGLLAYALTRATIEVLEGTAREPKWKRRKLKGIWPGM